MSPDKILALDVDMRGQPDGVLVLRGQKGHRRTIILFKAFLPETWSEEAREARAREIAPLIRDAAERALIDGRFSNLRQLGEDLEDADLVMLGWGDLIS